MPKKSIIVICNRTLNLGGIETSFVRFLNTLAKRSDIEVTAYIADNKGSLFEQISKNIHIEYISYGDSKGNLINDIKHFRIERVAKGLYYRMRLKFSDHFYVRIKSYYKVAEPHLKIPGEYDCAIAYSTDYSDLSIVLTKISAKKKVTFLHSDPTGEKRSRRMNDGLLRRFDKIYCVSGQIAGLCRIAHPKCADIVDTFYNILDTDEIRAKANENADLPYESKTTNILTVGRLSYDKAPDRAVEVAKKLVDSEYRIKWYFVGDGIMREQIEKSILHDNLDNIVCLLGQKENPYPYMKYCDIYVQSSRTEALSTTVNEAKILYKPIVACDFPGVREQIKSEKSGLIVESSVEGLYNGIKKLIDEPELRESFAEHLKGEKLDNSEELQKLYKFIES